MRVAGGGHARLGARALLAAWALWAVGCSTKASIVVTIRDPKGLAGDAASLVFGATREKLSESRPLERGSFPVSVTLVAQRGRSGPLFVEARTATGEVRARGLETIRFQGGYGEVLSIALERPCEQAAECDDGVFCNGPETCDEGRCMASSNPCSQLDEPCIRAVCVEAEQACALRVAPDLDDTNPCTLEACGDHVPIDDRQACALDSHAGVCLAGRCELCPAGDASCEDRALHLALGARQTCAARGRGTVQCWGGTGMPPPGDRVEVTGLMDIVGLTVGEHHACAARRSGTVRCWGENRRGELGIPPSAGFAVVDVQGLERVVAVAAGISHTCALLEDTSVSCFGDNAFGQLGDGSTADRAHPSRVVDLEGVRALAAGANHTCALRSDGSVWCWGANEWSQLGDDTSEMRARPIPVIGLIDAVSVAAGHAHGCAARRNGRVVCWGANDLGQLGDGTSTSRRSPVEVPRLNGVVALAAGADHTCVARGGGVAWCWGGNQDGQLGAPANVYRGSPSSVPDLKAVLQVAVGDRHSCAVQANGSLWCWGGNQDGQLGDGTRSSTSKPVEVRGL